MLAAFLFSTSAAAISPDQCTPCHGADGNSVTPGIPSIAGQPKIFLENLLVLVREGLRGSEQMQQILKGASDRDIVALAAHYSKLTVSAQPRALDTARFQRGRELAAEHRCGVCHLADFRGREQIPRLAGQREEYLADMMRRFRDAPPPGSDTLMSAVLYGVSIDDMGALAHFLAHSRIED